LTNIKKISKLRKNNNSCSLRINKKVEKVIKKETVKYLRMIKKNIKRKRPQVHINQTRKL
jgi:hypothetical protein